MKSRGTWTELEQRTVDPTDLRLLATWAGLLFLAVPAVNGVSPTGGDAFTAGTALLALFPLSTRIGVVRDRTGVLAQLDAE